MDEFLYRNMSSPHQILAIICKCYIVDQNISGKPLPKTVEIKKQTN